MSRKALIFWGGWDGHSPKQIAGIFERVLKQEHFEVEVTDKLETLEDANKLMGLNLIVPMWTMGESKKEQCESVMKAVESGVGLAGCHGGMGDAFRGSLEWQMMTGGQFLSHPGGGIDYTVNILPNRDPITEGIKDFKVHSEQYYMLIDPAVTVLASTVSQFPGPHLQCHTIHMPVVWTKTWGKGKVFYNALGHEVALVDSEPNLTLMRRGIPLGSQGAMIITIDGPAGTGKSTVAKAVADRLGMDFLDTGAMYRAIGLAAVRRQIDLNNARELAFVARHAKVEFDFGKHPPTVFLNGETVGHLLRSSETTDAASYVAKVPVIRELMVRQQQEIGRIRGNLLSEGRDQGSVVFPQADLKVYLDATPAERARRRVAQLRTRGEIVDQALILKQIVERDTRDSSRPIAPLAVPAGAIVIDTTSITEQQVIDQIIHLAQGRVGHTGTLST